MNGFKLAFRYLSCAALLVAAVEACSGDDSVAPIEPPGPPVLAILGVSLGMADSPVLACDSTIAVTLQVDDWLLRPPGLCASAQCGQAQVSLLGPDDTVLTSTRVASKGVVLDLSSFVADQTLSAGRYTVRAELVDDAGKVFVVTDGGNSSAEQTFALELPTGCESTPGAGGTSGDAGAAGVAGSAGAAGAASETGSAGATGEGGASGAATAAGAGGV